MLRKGCDMAPETTHSYDVNGLVERKVDDAEQDHLIVTSIA